MSFSAKLKKTLANPGLAWTRAGQSALKALCRPLMHKSFFLQGQMDIHPKGRWHNPDFVGEFGGFYPAGGAGDRRVVDIDPWDGVRRDMLVLLMRSLVEAKIDGAIAEVGVYKGQTAKLFHHYMPDRRIYLFDTFEGFSEADAGADPAAASVYKLDGNFTDTSLALAQATVAARNDNVRFKKGYFPDSADDEVAAETFALVHLDADLEAPIASGLRYFWPRLAPGGFIVAHDYNAWPGARRAVDAFCAEFKVFAMPMPDKSGSAVIRKG